MAAADGAAKAGYAAGGEAAAALSRELSALADAHALAGPAIAMATCARVHAAGLSLQGRGDAARAALACAAAAAALSPQRPLPRDVAPEVLRGVARAADAVRRWCAAQAQEAAQAAPACELLLSLLRFAASQLPLCPLTAPDADAALASAAAACASAAAAAVRLAADDSAASVAEQCATRAAQHVAQLLACPLMARCGDAMRTVAAAFAAAGAAAGCRERPAAAKVCAAVARDAAHARALASPPGDKEEAVATACAAAAALSDASRRSEASSADEALRPLARAAAAWHAEAPAQLVLLAARFVRLVGAAASTGDGGGGGGGGADDGQEGLSQACAAAPAMHALASSDDAPSGGNAQGGMVCALAAAELEAWRAHGRVWSLRRCALLAAAAAGDRSASPACLGAAHAAHAAMLRCSGGGGASAAAAAADAAAAAFAQAGAVDQQARALALGAMCAAEACTEEGMPSETEFRQRSERALALWPSCGSPASAGAAAAAWLVALADVAGALGQTGVRARALAALGSSRSGPAQEPQKGRAVSPALPDTLLACVLLAPALPQPHPADGGAEEALSAALSSLRVADAEDASVAAAPSQCDPQQQQRQSHAAHAHVLLLRCACRLDARDAAGAAAAADAACRLLAPACSAPSSWSSQHAAGDARWAALSLRCAALAALAECAAQAGLACVAERALTDADAAAAALGARAARAALHVRIACLRRRERSWAAAEEACDAAAAFLGPDGDHIGQDGTARALARAELLRVRGDLARRQPRSRVASLRGVDGGALELYAAALAAASPLARAGGAWARAATRCAARCSVGTAKCAAAVATADAIEDGADRAQRSAAAQAALRAATPHLDAAAQALGAGCEEAWEEAAMLLTSHRLHAAASPWMVPPHRAALLEDGEAQVAPIGASGRRSASATARGQAVAASSQPANLLERACLLARGAPCLLRAAAAARAAAACRAGDAGACCAALHCALGAAAAGEARFALATAALASSDGTDADGGAATLLVEADVLPPPRPATSLLTGPLQRGAIVTLSVADEHGVCGAGACENAPGARLLLTRVEAGAPPFALLLPTPPLSPNPARHIAWGTAELREVLHESDACRGCATETEAQRRGWWAARIALDARLAALCATMDSQWLGAWRVCLRGSPATGSPAAARASRALEAGLACLPGPLFQAPHPRHALSMLAAAAAAGAASREELAAALAQLGVEESAAQAAGAAMLAPPAAAASAAPGRASRSGAAQRRAAAGGAGVEVEEQQAGRPGAVLLLLDWHLAPLPWESCPGLAGERISRAPSLALVAVSLRMEGKKSGKADGPSQSPPPLPTANLDQAYFLLNPGGDLTATQARLEPLLDRQAGWQGCVGSLPAGGRTEHAARLATSPLFLYFGHGAGTQFLPSAALRVRRCATALALLMGCSSGALAPRGDFPPTGAALAYLAAGCGALVGNLWDVTDRDIDRFAEALLCAWLAAAGEGSADVHSGLEGARRACRLRALTGAAPVCYGLPALLLRGGE